jgi:hypothetical protein
MRITSNSQAGQDAFALMVARRQTYLDIGAGEPVRISNTKALDDAGWSGILCDIEHEARLRAERKAHAVYGDFFAQDWSAILRGFAPDGRIGYLSLDLEPPSLTLAALCKLPLDAVRFDCITVEHDLYRGNAAIRSAMRGILRDAGYELVAPDVGVRIGDAIAPFEDWWVDGGLTPAHLAAEIAAQIRSQWNAQASQA